MQNDPDESDALVIRSTDGCELQLSCMEFALFRLTPESHKRFIQFYRLPLNERQIVSRHSGFPVYVGPQVCKVTMSGKEVTDASTRNKVLTFAYDQIVIQQKVLPILRDGVRVLLPSEMAAIK